MALQKKQIKRKKTLINVMYALECQPAAAKTAEFIILCDNETK